MPAQTLNSPTANIYLAAWSITETEEELLAKGGHALAHTADYQRIQATDKRKEWLASRLLIETAVRTQALPYHGIEKDQFNKPSLIGLKQELSLSHTKGLAVVAISQHLRIGVDAEYLSPRIARIAPKFLHEKELERAKGDWKELLSYWCAKEALYKLYGKKGLAFKEQIRVDKNFNATEFYGQIDAIDETIEVHLQLKMMDHHMIVTAIEQ